MRLRFLKTGVIAGAMALGLSACDVAYPVSVIGPEGTVFRGSATNTFLAGGQFHATNGTVVCQGTYRQHTDITTVGFPVICNNGMTGIGTAQFASATSGAGIVTMSDGTRWQFLFGQGALRI